MIEKKTNKEVIEYIKDVYFGFVEGDHFLDYCNGYGDGYIHALWKNKLITKKQMTELETWNNGETQRWLAIAKEDCKMNVKYKIGNKEEHRK